MIRSACVLCVLWLGASCSAPKANKNKPSPQPAVATPADAAKPANSEVTDDGDTELSLEFLPDKASADLDGDTKPERIAWTCGKKLSVTVGAARASAPLDISELIGCSAALVSLRPSNAARQLLIVADEHEEVGPDHQFLFSYDGTALTLIWSGVAALTFHKDGSWVGETTDCDDAKRVLRTTSRVMRWDGTSVKAKQSVATSPINAGDCAEP